MEIIKEFTSPYERSFLCRINNTELDRISAIRGYNNCKRYLLVTGLTEYEIKGVLDLIGKDFGCEPCFNIEYFDTGYEAELYAQLKAYRKAYKNLLNKFYSIGQLHTNFKFTTEFINEEVDTSNEDNNGEK